MVDKVIRFILLRLLIFLVFLLALPLSSQARVDVALPGDTNLIIEGFLENYTTMRSDDFRFSKQMSLTNFRNTAQFEITLENLIKNCGLIDRVDLFTIIRGVYDGVYDINTDTYGDTASQFQRNGKTMSRFLEFPRAFISNQPVVLPVFPTVARARNSGRYDVGHTESDLEWWHNESNDERELRELYLDMTMGRHWFRIGKQQIVWGKTDFFRSQDIPNPIDFGRHGFYDSWEDIRIPQWSTRYQYQAGSIGPFDNIALELVWLWDNFEPTGLGQGGEPWAHPFNENLRLFSIAYDATWELRRQLSAAGFAIPVPPTGSMGSQAQWKWKKYGSTMSHSEWGGRLEFRWKDWRFALSEWYGYQDDGAYVHFPWVNWEPYPGRPYNGLLEAMRAGPGPFGPDPVLSAFLGIPVATGGYGIVEHPKRHTFGLSADYFHEYSATVWRIESSLTPNLRVTSTDQLFYKDQVDQLKWSVGVDRPTYLWLLNPNKSIFLSAQVLATHNLRHSGGQHTGMLNWPHEFTFTFLAQTDYYRDRIKPQVWIAYSPQFVAYTGGINCEWLVTDHWSIKAGANIISGKRQSHDHWPYTGFMNAPATVEALLDPTKFPFLLTEAPFDRVQEWPFSLVKEGFGAYRDRDEMYFIMRYRF
jgi:hypothetical protein